MNLVISTSAGVALGENESPRNTNTQGMNSQVQNVHTLGNQVLNKAPKAGDKECCGDFWTKRNVVYLAGTAALVFGVAAAVASIWLTGGLAALIFGAGLLLVGAGGLCIASAADQAAAAAPLSIDDQNLLNLSSKVGNPDPTDPRPIRQPNTPPNSGSSNENSPEQEEFLNHLKAPVKSSDAPEIQAQNVKDLFSTLKNKEIHQKLDEGSCKEFLDDKESLTKEQRIQQCLYEIGSDNNSKDQLHFVTENGSSEKIEGKNPIESLHNSGKINYEEAQWLYKVTGQFIFNAAVWSINDQDAVNTAHKSLDFRLCENANTNESRKYFVYREKNDGSISIISMKEMDISLRDTTYCYRKIDEVLLISKVNSNGTLTAILDTITPFTKNLDPLTYLSVNSEKKNLAEKNEKDRVKTKDGNAAFQMDLEKAQQEATQKDNADKIKQAELDEQKKAERQAEKERQAEIASTRTTTTSLDVIIVKDASTPQKSQKDSQEKDASLENEPELLDQIANLIPIDPTQYTLDLESLKSLTGKLQNELNSLIAQKAVSEKQKRTITNIMDLERLDAKIKDVETVLEKTKRRQEARQALREQHLHNATIFAQNNSTSRTTTPQIDEKTRLQDRRNRLKNL
jgi:hypothetical protein